MEEFGKARIRDKNCMAKFMVSNINIILLLIFIFKTFHIACIAIYCDLGSANQMTHPGP